MHRINIQAALLIIVCAGLIQASAFNYISILGTKPDLLFITAIFLSLCAAPDEVIKTAALAGFIKDLTSAAVFGSYTASFLIVSLFLNFHQNKFFKERISTQALAVFIAYLVSDFLVFMFNLISYKTAVSYGLFLAIALKGAAYTATIAPFCFFALSRILRVDLAPA